MERFFSWFKQVAPQKEESTEQIDQTRSVKSAIKKSVSFASLITLLLLTAMYLSFKENKIFVILSILAVIVAFFIAGCVLGFIFGIPKKYQNKQAAVQLDKDGKPLQPADPNYTDNSSLEEISDWITKIIIGLSMVQYKAILNMIDAAATNINKSLQNAICVGQACKLDFYVFSYALIIFYPIVGAIIGYLWTRIEFPYILDQKDRDLREANRARDKAESKLDEAKELNKLKEEDLQAFVQTFTPATDSMIGKREEFKHSNQLPDDPQKGKWGGKSEVKDRKISATVRESSFDSNWFNINLTVTSTNSDHPLVGDVVFHLHPSFINEVRKIKVLDGVAQYNIIGWGAFTVGVECDENKTKLELDLAELTNAPELFRKR